jgi:hypothetical protein
MSSTLATCQNDVSYVKYQLGFWEKEQSEPTKTVSTDIYKRMRMALEKELANDYSVMEALKKTTSRNVAR